MIFFDMDEHTPNPSRRGELVRMNEHTPSPSHRGELVRLNGHTPNPSRRGELRTFTNNSLKNKNLMGVLNKML